MKDKVEIFSDRAHHVALGEERVLQAINNNTDTHWKHW